MNGSQRSKAECFCETARHVVRSRLAHRLSPMALRAVARGLCEVLLGNRDSRQRGTSGSYAHAWVRSWFNLRRGGAPAGLSGRETNTHTSRPPDNACTRVAIDVSTCVWSIRSSRHAVLVSAIDVRSLVGTSGSSAGRTCAVAGVNFYRWRSARLDLRGQRTTHKRRVLSGVVDRELSVAAELHRGRGVGETVCSRNGSGCQRESAES